MADSIITASDHQTNLLYQEVHRVDDANRLFGACYDGNTVIIINPGRSLIKPYIRIPEGTYALVQNQGRDVDGPDGSATWPAGFHWASPFTQVSHLVTKQFIVFETPVKGCKTQDNVSVQIDMCLVLRIMGDAEKGEDPALVRRFVYELGANGLETQLRAAQDEAVRSLARSVQHQEVYKLRGGTLQDDFATGSLDKLDRDQNEDNHEVDDVANVKKDIPEHNSPAPSKHYVTEDIKKNLNLQFNPYGVEIINVSISSVHLPDTFQDQMQSKTTHLSAIKEQKMKQKSDMQLLSYKEEIDTTKLARRMMIMEEESTGKAKCAQIQKEIDLVEMDIRVVQEEIEQNRKVTCNKIVADTSLAIEEIHAETQQISSEILADCEAQIQLIKAKTNALKMRLQADTEEIHVAGDSKVTEILARAEGDAAKNLEKYRAFKIDMEKLNILSSLADNKDYVATGNASNSLLAEMLVANKHGNLLLNIGENGMKGLIKTA